MLTNLAGLSILAFDVGFMLARLFDGEVRFPEDAELRSLYVASFDIGCGMCAFDRKHQENKKPLICMKPSDARLDA
jgi:hypothetical protein